MSGVRHRALLDSHRRVETEGTTKMTRRYIIRGRICNLRRRGISFSNYARHGAGINCCDHNELVAGAAAVSQSHVREIGGNYE